MIVLTKGVKIRFDTDCIRYIGLFESMTGVVIKDCIVSPDKLLFIVKEGQAGLAIGKGGANIKNMQSMLNKTVEVIEFSPDPINFVANIFKPFSIKKAYLSQRSDDKQILRVEASGGVLGKFRMSKPNVTLRSKLKKAKFLLEKYFGIEDLILM